MHSKIPLHFTPFSNAREIFTHGNTLRPPTQESTASTCPQTDSQFSTAFRQHYDDVLQPRAFSHCLHIWRVPKATHSKQKKTRGHISTFEYNISPHLDSVVVAVLGRPHVRTAVCSRRVVVVCGWAMTSPARRSIYSGLVFSFSCPPPPPPHLVV